jgi:hypothetical protein
VDVSVTDPVEGATDAEVAGVEAPAAVVAMISDVGAVDEATSGAPSSLQLARKSSPTATVMERRLFIGSLDSGREARSRPMIG